MDLQNTNEMGNGRKNLGIQCTKEELNSMKLIRNKSSCTNQAVDPRNIPDLPYSPPKGASKEMVEEMNRRRDEYKEKVTLFIKGALEAKAEVSFLEEMWWSEMIEKYNLEGKVYLDFGTGDFFINTTEQAG